MLMEYLKPEAEILDLAPSCAIMQFSSNPIDGVGSADNSFFEPLR